MKVLREAGLAAGDDVVVRRRARVASSSSGLTTGGAALRLPSAIDRDLARRAAGLRARQRSLRLPDALSLATALTAGADLVMLDQRLRRVARGEQETE